MIRAILSEFEIVIFLFRFEECEVKTVGGGDTDQRRSPHMHFFDGFYGFFKRIQPFNDKGMRQVALVDDPDGLLIFRVYPNGPIWNAVYFHDSGL